jgi:hypothetical protein
MPIPKPISRQTLAQKFAAGLTPRLGAAIAGCVASAAMVLPVAAGGSNGSGAPQASRDKTEWTTAVVVPKPPLKCEQTFKVAGVAAGAGPHSELQARHNAIESWRAQVSDRHGYDYAQWWRARDKDVSCRVAGGGHACEALAAPCMADGGTASTTATRSGLGMAGAAR